MIAPYSVRFPIGRISPAASGAVRLAAPIFWPAAMSGGVKSVYGSAMIRILILIVSLIAACSRAHAADTVTYAQNVTFCPALSTSAPPDFDGPDCRKVRFWAADPQGRTIWLRAEVEAPPVLADPGRPAAVFVSAKAASAVYLNGVALGENGVPALSKEEETPGRMDSVFYAPRDTLKPGVNEITILFSSYHGFLRFGYPVHWIGLGEYHDPTTLILNAYWPSFVPLGVLIAGALYFFVMTFNGADRLNALILSLISLLAAGQLVTEVYRGLTAYAYPVHEWRMLLILGFSIGFALCLMIYIVNRFMDQKKIPAAAGASLIIIASTFLIVGYDGKAGVAVLTATAISALITGYAAYQKQPQALLHCIALAIFALVVLAFPSKFLDVIFFYEVAGLLLLLFIAQALAFARERKILEEERARSRQLALSLERAESAVEAQHLSINGAGKIDIVTIGDIAYCKGAGDYVEVALENGRKILHHSTLTQLEDTLPGSFLRVHRSYLVNTDKIRNLSRESSGGGVLTLSCDATIPVSRRIMPKVRSALY